MSEAREPRALIQAAEAAAEAGTYASAEALLREAARLQEASLGPRHPDLANTLNNLGVVCEITGKADDAEQYFRRAVSIARTALHPDHPFVATSQKNLRDFCEARGKKVELPAPAAPAPLARRPAPPPPPAESTARAATAGAEPKPPAPEDSEIEATKLFRRVAFGALGPIAMLMVVLAAGLPRLTSPPEAAPLPALPVPVEAPPIVVPPVREEIPDRAEVSVGAEARHAKAAASADTRTLTRALTDDSETRPVVAARPVAASQPVVVRASLCGDLDDWLCDPADRPVPMGPLFFYTQIKSASATTVQHRWYHDARLVQTVTLRVQANRSGGYRTYSQNLMKSQSAGSWRIELRSEDGAVLHEERFTVH